MESSRHWKRDDAGWGRFLSQCGQRCERYVAGSGILPGLVASARFARKSGNEPLHTLSSTRGCFAWIFALLSHLCAHFAEHAIAQLTELFTDQPVVWPFADVATLFAHKSELLPDQPKLLAHKSELLADKPELFSDVPVIFSHESQLLADKSQLFANIPLLLSNVPVLFAHQPLLFTHKSLVLPDEPKLFTNKPELLPH